jgi:hypothetical protein
MTIVCAAIEWLLSTTLSTVHGRLREFASARQSRARPRRELPFSTHFSLSIHCQSDDRYRGLTVVPYTL